GPERRGLIVHFGRLRFEAGRRAEPEREESEVHAVTGHVAERAGAEVPKSTPFEGDVRRVVRPPGRDAEPQVPIERWRHRRSFLWALNSLRPPVVGPVGPDVNLAHLAEHAALDQFDKAARM